MSEVKAPQRASGPRVDATLGFAAAAAYLILLALAMTRVSYDVWGALVVAPALTAGSLVLLARARRRDVDPWIGKLLVVAFVTKMVGAVVRYAARTRS